MTQFIIHTICDKYKITQEQLCQKTVRRQIQKVVEIKQIAAYLLWRYRCGNRVEIAKLLGYPSKQNINHARRQIKKIAEGNHAFNAELETLEKSILRN